MSSATMERRAEQSGMCPMPGDDNVAFQWVRIDKELALQFLRTNTRNRNMNKERVARYARDMREGQWWHGSVLNIGIDGIFQNGQHRLQAVVVSDTVHWFGIIKGLPERAQDTMDQGLTRSFGGQLRIRGEKNSNSLAALVRSLWFYKDIGRLAGTTAPRQPSITELSELLDEHPGTRGCIKKNEIWTGISGGYLGAFNYLAGIQNPEEVAEFLSILHGGGTMMGNPIRALQDRMSKEMARRDKPTTLTRTVFLIKTWNSWMKGEEARGLRWSPYGPLAEQVPLIYGCPILPRTRQG